MRFTHARFTVTAGAVIFNDKGEVLLLKHRFRAGSGWGLPGGFMETDEQPIDALRRELREEIGLEVEEGFELHGIAGGEIPKPICTALQ